MAYVSLVAIDIVFRGAYLVQGVIDIQRRRVGLREFNTALAGVLINRVLKKRLDIHLGRWLAGI